MPVSLKSESPLWIIEMTDKLGCLIAEQKEFNQVSAGEQQWPRGSHLMRMLAVDGQV